MSQKDEIIGLILEWISLSTRPNENRRYSRCIVCGYPWWDDKETHEFTCWVPMFKSAFKAQTATCGDSQERSER